MPRPPANGAAQRRLGARAEALAEELLVRKGAFVLARNFVGRRGELDLVVALGDTVAVVEVRRRKGGVDDALGSIPETKRRSVVRATREYVERAGLHERPVRFDVVAVGPARKGSPADVIHVEDAFDASGVDD